MTSAIELGLAREIIEQAADAIIFADIHGVIQSWNRAATATFGFSGTEAVGQSLDIIIPTHLRGAHWAGFHRAMESGETRLAGHATITRALHRNGRRLYVEMSFAVVRDPAGTIAGSVAVARDVTLRYANEKAGQRVSREKTHSATVKPPSP
ncbi:MAG: PAS domain S-box protein [Steroidobacteraceae bacterium]